MVLILIKNKCDIIRDKSKKKFGLNIIRELFMYNFFKPVLIWCSDIRRDNIPVFHKLDAFRGDAALHEFEYVLHHLIKYGVLKFV